MAIHLLKGIGPGKFLLALGKLGSAQEILRYLFLLKNISGQQAFFVTPAADTFPLKKQIEQAVAQAHQYPPEIFVVYGEATYPVFLKEIPDPPIALFFKGNSELLQEKASISVVGTRAITAYGVLVTKKFCTELAVAGVCIISGLAFGVDALAHGTALANGGKTIAVLGSGIAKAVPVSNWRLFNQIAQNGLIISEYFDLPVIAKGTFPRRNRIIAGMSPATLVTEAPEKSGALITARLAFCYDREVFAIPGNINAVNSAGCNALIRNNIAISCSDSSEIFLDLHLQVPNKSVKNEFDLSENQQRITKFLVQGPADLAKLQQNLHLHDRILAEAVLDLEIKQQLGRDQAGRYFLL